jgi:hypothetical protein
MMDDGTTGELGGSRTRRSAALREERRACGENEKDLVDLLRKGALQSLVRTTTLGRPRHTRTSRLVVRRWCRCSYVFFTTTTIDRLPRSFGKFPPAPLEDKYVLHGHGKQRRDRVQDGPKLGNGHPAVGGWARPCSGQSKTRSKKRQGGAVSRCSFRVRSLVARHGGPRGLVRDVPITARFDQLMVHRLAFLARPQSRVISDATRLILAPSCPLALGLPLWRRQKAASTPSTDYETWARTAILQGTRTDVGELPDRGGPRPCRPRQHSSERIPSLASAGAGRLSTIPYLVYLLVAWHSNNVGSRITIY